MSRISPRDDWVAVDAAMEKRVEEHMVAFAAMTAKQRVDMWLARLRPKAAA